MDLTAGMTAFAYGTTYFSAVIFIGYAGQFGRTFGLASIWIGIGNAIIGTLIAWFVLAKRTKSMTQRLSAKTMPEFFEKLYDDKKTNDEIIHEAFNKPIENEIK